jgi:hypothetical protein
LVDGLLLLLFCSLVFFFMNSEGKVFSVHWSQFRLQIIAPGMLDVVLFLLLEAFPGVNFGHISPNLWAIGCTWWILD